MESRQKYVQAVKNVLINESLFPSVEFVRFFADQIYSSPQTDPTDQAISEFASIVKEAFHQFLGDQMNKWLSSTGRNSGSENKLPRNINHISSDEEFEGFFVVNVA